MATLFVLVQTYCTPAVRSRSWPSMIGESGHLCSTHMSTLHTPLSSGWSQQPSLFSGLPTLLYLLFLYVIDAGMYPPGCCHTETSKDVARLSGVLDICMMVRCLCTETGSTLSQWISGGVGRVCKCVHMQGEDDEGVEVLLSPISVSRRGYPPIHQ